MKRIPLKAAISFLMMSSVLLSVTIVNGQTNPAPFDLSSGSYHFTSWDTINAAGTYPSNMVFHWVPANPTAPFYTDGTSDFVCSYHKSKRPRVNGLMQQGIGLITTSSSQYNDCDAGAADNRFIGAVVLAINTTQRSNIQVSWKSQTTIPGDGNGDPTNPRVWNLRLQYRLGTSGLFTDYPGPVEFISSTSIADSVQFGPLALPSECNNTAVVELRWIYFESSAGIGGSRPQIRLDEVLVSSENALGTAGNQASPDAMFSVSPNPAQSGFRVTTAANGTYEIRLTDQLGKQLMQSVFSRNSAGFDCSNLAKGIYFVKLTELSTGISETRKLLVQ